MYLTAMYTAAKVSEREEREEREVGEEEEGRGKSVIAILSF